VRLFPVLPALAALAALGLPATAQADVTTAVNGHTLTVTGSAGTDTITLRAAGGVITVNDVPTTLPANRGAIIVVNAGDGNDSVDAQTLGVDDYDVLTVNAGNGNDFLTGGASADVLNGGPGDDRLEGRGGFDGTNGDEGDDTTVWNAGDGLEISDGGAGADELDVTGSPTADDVFTAVPDQIVQGDATLDGDGVVITFSAEKLEFDGLGGNDAFGPDESQTDTAPRLGQLTTLTLDGGDGNDVLAGFDGNDQLTPGGHDLIEGGPGDDRLTGNGGLDLVDGGPGDDDLVWNDGDGTDELTGGDGFDRLDVSGSATEGDDFRYVVDHGVPTFERTNLVPVALAFVAPDDPGPEAIAFSGRGGDDTLTIAPGSTRPQVSADGGDGNDTLTGGDEVDTFSGGAGNDVLDPGPGSDSVDGGDGDDRIAARDGAADRVQGGPGTDSARTDALTLDAVDGVENVDAPPLPSPPGPASAPAPSTGSGTTAIPVPKVAGDTSALLPTVGRARVLRRHGRLVVALAVTCPAAETGGCRSMLTLRAGHTAVGHRTVRLDGGAHATVTIRVARAATRLARHRLRLRIATADAAGNTAAGTVAVALRLPRR